MHSLLFLHTQRVIKAQQDKAKKSDDDDDDGGGGDGDDNGDETDTESMNIDGDE